MSDPDNMRWVHRMRDRFQRYAIYALPPPGPLAAFGARWLGWDIAAGRAVPQHAPPGLPAPVAGITGTPRRYGLHATIKPPFRLSAGSTPGDLTAALDRLCARYAPVTLGMLRLVPLGRFLALVPSGTADRIDALAAATVAGLDPFRAPASGDEVARRRQSGLTEAQARNLATWGYPHVMDCFRFHITLTGKLPKPLIEPVRNVLDAALAPLLPAPFVVGGLTLAGEDRDGFFHALHHSPLTGPA